MKYTFQDFVNEYRVADTPNSDKFVWRSVWDKKLPRWALKSMFREERDWLDRHYPIGTDHEIEWDLFWQAPPQTYNVTGWADVPRDPEKLFWENVSEVCQMLNEDGTYPIFDNATGEWVNAFNAKRICNEMLESGIGWITLRMVKEAQNKLKKRAKKKAA